VLESGLSTPGALDREFGDELPASRRSWERYANGSPTPSISFGGVAGIVQQMAWRFPKTMTVFTSPLWTVLHPDAQFHQKVVDKLLLQLSPRVHEQFIYIDANGALQRDWSNVVSGMWDYPDSDLTIDYLAAYLALFRELRESGRHDVAELAETWLLDVLEMLKVCPILGGFSGEIFDFVKDHFLHRR